VWIVIEFAEGGNVFDRIRKKLYYTEIEAKNIAKSLLEAVTHIHSKGIVHRDLKPENMILLSNGNDVQVKICDFGLASFVSDLRHPEPICGTPQFVSPEILRFEPYSTEPDIWSLGVVFYELLAGYPPFRDHSQTRLFRHIEKGAYTFEGQIWSAISDEARVMIFNMLQVDRERRCTAEQLLQHKWIEMTEEELALRNLVISQAGITSDSSRREQ